MKNYFSEPHVQRILHLMLVAMIKFIAIIGLITLAFIAIVRNHLEKKEILPFRKKIPQ